MSNERNFTLAWGIRVEKDPDTMTREEAVNALYDVAEFASRAIVEARMLKNIVGTRLEGK